MEGNRKSRTPPMPQVDDGWWASVLGEENRQVPATRARPGLAQRSENAVTSTAASPPLLDWSRILEIFRTDQIISLKVTGHNRGGLLVGGDGVSGFVPLSHLVDVASRIPEGGRSTDLGAYMGGTVG